MTNSASYFGGQYLRLCVADPVLTDFQAPANGPLIAAILRDSLEDPDAWHHG